MSTFIWNTEYEVFVANAATVEEARHLLVLFWQQEKTIFYSEAEDLPTRKGRLRNHFRDAIEVWDKLRGTPDIIVPEGSAMRYDHSNE